MFKIRFLPARFGDSIRIAYGDPDRPKFVLIDGGTALTRRDIRADLQSFAQTRCRLELLVVTHIDRDHIEGVLKLLEEGIHGLEIGDVWFNGWPHLPENNWEEFGAVQGERLTAQIWKHHLPWNAAFDHRAVVIPEVGSLPERTLSGGLRLTLLNPHPEALVKLKRAWEKEVRGANLDPGFGMAATDDDPVPVEIEDFGALDLPNVEALAATKYEDDASPANCSSIAVIAEYEGKRVLLAGDAPAGPLLKSLERYSATERVQLDLFKLSHHGSKNTTSSSLIEKVQCSCFVFSTNGSIYNHPDDETVARVIAAADAKLELCFNYQTQRNQIWNDRSLQEKYGYKTQYPAAVGCGIEIEL